MRSRTTRCRADALIRDMSGLFVTTPPETYCLKTSPPTRPLIFSKVPLVLAMAVERVVTRSVLVRYSFDVGSVVFIGSWPDPYPILALVRSLSYAASRWIGQAASRIPRQSTE